MILRAHGEEGIPLTDTEARAIILQWENNNAQMGYIRIRRARRSFGYRY